MFFDLPTMIMMGITAAISGLATMWVKGSFNKYSRVGARSGMTGRQVAAAILSYHGITDVKIEPVAGSLTDHYDPTSKTLRLSEPNFEGRSIAALGVSAHEVGHAIQHAEAYAWLGFRSAMVPVLGFSSKFSTMLIMGAFVLIMLGQGPLAKMVGLVGVVLFGASTLFSLVTLPVEFDASRRALVALESGQILAEDEMVGARRVLRAAAATYVAAAITSLAWLLYYAWRLGLIGGGRRD